MKLNLDLRPEELQRNIAKLDWREYLLLISSVLFVFLLGVALFAALSLGNFAEQAMGRGIDRRLYLICGSSIGLGLAAAHFVRKGRRALHNARENLVRTALGVDGVENLRLLDPLTGLFNRLYLEKFVSKETAVAKRMGINLTFLMIQARENGRSKGRRSGAISDRSVTKVGQLLRTIFRNSDTLVRFSENEFLVLLLGCKEPNAQEAAEGFLAQMDRWNQEATEGNSKIFLRYSTAAYAGDDNLAALLGTLREKMRASEREPEPQGCEA
ncbi:MAG TPA: diguanylate cyclase [Candidatus Acidoferrales bacterium]|nr:diguanylate cyclase [Candidatus Acidoferrales bacterium]